MYSRFVLSGGLIAAAMIAAACGSGTPYAAAPSASPTDAYSVSPVASSPTPVASPSASPSGTRISAATTRLGTVLVGGNGRTLYLFLADSGTTSNCNSAGCVQYWPPLLTKGVPQAGSGVNASLLGTTRRRDGSSEVTYAGHPLYYFLSDRKPGDVTGQGISAFGARWYVVSPSGMQIV